MANVIKQASALLLSLMVVACSGAGFGGADKKEDKSQKTTPTSSQSENNSDQASTPVSVAGAFLVQEVDESKSNANKTAIAVTVKDANNERVTNDSLTFAVKINNSDTNVAPLDRASGPHFYYLVNNELIPNGTVEVTVKKGQDIFVVDRQQLDNIAQFSPPPGNLSLAGRTGLITVVNSAKIALIKNFGYDPSGSCENGVPRPSYRPDGLIQSFGADTTINADTVPQAKLFDPTSQAYKRPPYLCYLQMKQFSGGMLPGFAKSAGCYTFFMTDAQSRLYIFVTPETKMKTNSPQAVANAISDQMCH